jgi:hypothetical protein
MTIETIRAVLGWCSVINMGLLLWWWLLFVFARDFVYSIHAIWFKVPLETFDIMNYAGMGIYKMLIFVFNLVPYAALRIVGKRS